MDVATHTAYLRQAGRRLAEAAESAGTDAKVPSCPAWTVGDLVRHAAGVHRWAASFLADPARVPSDADEAFFTAADDDAVVDDYRQAHGALVAAIESAPADRQCWSFLAAPSPVAFWARRQAHEATVHAVDAELAAGTVRPVDAALGADGIDELLCGFLARPRGRLVADPPVRLAVIATDAPLALTIAVEPDRRVVTAGAGEADCVVRGPAGALYLRLWNRRGADDGAVEVEGDEAVLALWAERATVVWG